LQVPRVEFQAVTVEWAMLDVVALEVDKKENFPSFPEV